MQHLNRYVPRNVNHILSLCCNGDQLSVQRMAEARLAMGTSSDPINRMTGLEPTPQQFHQQAILLQVDLDIYIIIWLGVVKQYAQVFASIELSDMMMMIICLNVRYKRHYYIL